MANHLTSEIQHYKIATHPLNFNKDSLLVTWTNREPV